MNANFDVVVIGGGPAGLAAAAAAKTRNPALSVLIVERDRALGGILQQCVHNGFGLHRFGEELTGPEYAQRFIDLAKKAGVETWTDTMVLSLCGTSLTVVSAERGLVKIDAKSVVLAMGCRERTRGALMIPGDRPAGVMTAGCAQRLVNMEGLLPGRNVVILGSGDIGLIMARRLTFEGAKVRMVCEIMPESGGLQRNIVQCLDDFDIPLRLNHTVTRVIGHERVEAVEVAEVDPATRKPIEGTREVVPCDTLLLSVGLIPENELTRGAGIEMDPVTNGAVVTETRETSLPGVFACGNVLHVHDLVDNVSEEAERAGRAAAEFADDARERKIVGAVRAGAGVRYCVPQKISAEAGKTELYFRVTTTKKNATAVVRAGGQTLGKRKKNIMTPGEMEKITVDLTGIAGDVEIGLAEGAEA